MSALTRFLDSLPSPGQFFLTMTSLIGIGFILVVGFNLLTGKINTNGLLIDKGTKALSVGRVQLLISTLVAVFYYLSLIHSSSRSLPDVPEQVVLLLTGSNSLYLGEKALPLFRSLFFGNGRK